MSKSKRRSVDQTLKTGSPESLDVQQAPSEKKTNKLLLFFHRKKQPKVRSIDVVSLSISSYCHLCTDIGLCWISLVTSVTCRV